MSDTTGCDNKLPYTLTEGVVATREGLVFELWKNNAIDLFIDRFRIELTYEYVNGDIMHRRISWPDAAERLRYREGEPWCAAQSVPELACGVEWFPDWDDLPRLHRLAAILCDDAGAFRVLHACIEEFSDG